MMLVSSTWSDFSEKSWVDILRSRLLTMTKPLLSLAVWLSILLSVASLHNWGIETVERKVRRLSPQDLTFPDASLSLSLSVTLYVSLSLSLSLSVFVSVSPLSHDLS
jgi:hypothetical protein